MTGVAKRMRHLKSLLSIRLGPGAAILPKDVKRIHMDFAYRMEDGHMGPRRFWRTCLPRLKYHNPAVSMTVNRTINQEGPATMTVFFAAAPDTSAAAAAPSGSSVNERIEVIDMKNEQSSDILEKLLGVTKAVKVDATEEEVLELRRLAEGNAKSEMDRVRERGLHEKIKAERALLARAKESVSMMT